MLEIIRLFYILSFLKDKYDVQFAMLILSIVTVLIQFHTKGPFLKIKHIMQASANVVFYSLVIKNPIFCTIWHEIPSVKIGTNRSNKFSRNDILAKA